MVTLVSISLVTITVDYRQGDKGPLEGLGRAALTVISPLQKAVSKITHPIGSFFSALTNLPTLQRENRRLKQDIDEARAALAEFADQQALIAKYEGLLGIKEDLGSLQSLPATVIANSPSNFEWSVTIDKGSRDGIHSGDAVIGSAGLVGHVVRVTPLASDVQLITDPDSQVAGKVVSTPETGLVSGQGENDLRMGLVDPQTPTEDLNNQQIETVSYEVGDQSNRYPPGIQIGKISRVLPSFGSTEKFVTVRPNVDFSSLDTVLVVLTPDSG